jgi:hypothetical protein
MILLVKDGFHVLCEAVFIFLVRAGCFFIVVCDISTTVLGCLRQVAEGTLQRDSLIQLPSKLM